MESLIELVAASLARHGIECPDGGSGWERTASPVCPDQGLRVEAERTSLLAVAPTSPTALPEHNFRKQSDSEPAA